MRVDEIVLWLSDLLFLGGYLMRIGVVECWVDVGFPGLRGWHKDWVETAHRGILFLLLLFCKFNGLMFVLTTLLCHLVESCSWFPSTTNTLFWWIIVLINFLWRCYTSISLLFDHFLSNLMYISLNQLRHFLSLHFPVLFHDWISIWLFSVYIASKPSLHLLCYHAYHITLLNMLLFVSVDIFLINYQSLSSSRLLVNKSLLY